MHRASSSQNHVWIISVSGIPQHPPPNQSLTIHPNSSPNKYIVFTRKSLLVIYGKHALLQYTLWSRDLALSSISKYVLSSLLDLKKLQERVKIVIHNFTETPKSYQSYYPSSFANIIIHLSFDRAQRRHRQIAIRIISNHFQLFDTSLYLRMQFFIHIDLGSNESKD